MLDQLAPVGGHGCGRISHLPLDAACVRKVTTPTRQELNFGEAGQRHHASSTSRRPQCRGRLSRRAATTDYFLGHGVGTGGRDADTYASTVSSGKTGSRQLNTYDGSALTARSEVREGKHEDRGESRDVLFSAVRGRSACFEPVVDDACDAALEGAECPQRCVAVCSSPLEIVLARAFFGDLHDSDAMDGGELASESGVAADCCGMPDLRLRVPAARRRHR